MVKYAVGDRCGPHQTKLLKILPRRGRARGLFLCATCEHRVYEADINNVVGGRTTRCADCGDGRGCPRILSAEAEQFEQQLSSLEDSSP